jgi:hypothetical protein
VRALTVTPLADPTKSRLALTLQLDPRLVNIVHVDLIRPPHLRRRALGTCRIVLGQRRWGERGSVATVHVARMGGGIPERIERAGSTSVAVIRREGETFHGLLGGDRIPMAGERAGAGARSLPRARVVGLGLREVRRAWRTNPQRRTRGVDDEHTGFGGGSGGSGSGSRSGCRRRCRVE